MRIAGTDRAAAREGVLLPLEVTKNRAGIDAQIARGLRAVAVVALEDLQHVAALKVFFRLFERKNGQLGTFAEIEIVWVE